MYRQLPIRKSKKSEKQPAELIKPFKMLMVNFNSFNALVIINNAIASSSGVIGNGQAKAGAIAAKFIE